MTEHDAVDVEGKLSAMVLCLRLKPVTHCSMSKTIMKTKNFTIHPQMHMMPTASCERVLGRVAFPYRFFSMVC